MATWLCSFNRRLPITNYFQCNRKYFFFGIDFISLYSETWLNIVKYKADEVEITNAENLANKIHSIMPWFYFPLFHSSTMQATPGKYLLELKLIIIEGNKLTLLRAIATNNPMVDKHFYKISKAHTIAEIAKATNCEILFPQESRYNQDTPITAIKSLTLASDGDISFLSNKKYVKDFDNSCETAFIVPIDLTTKTEKI